MLATTRQTTNVLALSHSISESDRPKEIKVGETSLLNP